MSHQVSLRGDAYEALKREKRQGESFSDVVLRVLAQLQARQKDPWTFVRGGAPSERGVADRLAEVERWRDADMVDPER